MTLESNTYVFASLQAISRIFRQFLPTQTLAFQLPVRRVVSELGHEIKGPAFQVPCFNILVVQSHNPLQRKQRGVEQRQLQEQLD